MLESTSAPAGQLLREWRMRRRMSQLDLASEAGVSARHLSFVETGRSRPSRSMVLHLAENLDIPLLERELLGYADDMGINVPPPAEAPRAIATPMRLRTDDGELALMTMIATFGTALDITLAELSLETFLPADAATASALFARMNART